MSEINIKKKNSVAQLCGISSSKATGRLQFLIKTERIFQVQKFFGSLVMLIGIAKAKEFNLIAENKAILEFREKTFESLERKLVRYARKERRHIMNRIDKIKNPFNEQTI